MSRWIIPPAPRDELIAQAVATAQRLAVTAPVVVSLNRTSAGYVVEIRTQGGDCGVIECESEDDALFLDCDIRAALNGQQGGAPDDTD